MNILSLKLKNAVYVLGSTLFFGLYFLRDVFDISISYYLIYSVAVIIVLFSDFSYTIAFFVSLSALSNTGFESEAIILLIAVFVLRYILNQNIFAINRNSLIIVVVVLYELLHYFIFGFPALSSIAKYFAYIFIAFLILSVPSEKINKKAVIDSFICFSFFFACLTILISLKAISWNINVLFAEGLRFQEYEDILTGKRIYLLGNQNFISALCSVNMGILAWRIENSPKVFCILLFGFFLFAGLLTLSKLFFLTIVFFFFLLLLLIWKKNPKKIFSAALLSIGFFLCIYFLFKDTLIQLIINRFLKGIASGDITTGRIDTYQKMFRYLSKNLMSLFIGTGILNLYSVLGESVHSNVLEVIGGWGLLGIPLFYLLIRMIIKNANEYKKRNNIITNPLSYMPLIIGLVYSLGGMMFSEAGSYLRIILYMYILEEGKQ